jgi:uncharacterized protein (TIGR02246 family)
MKVPLLVLVAILLAPIRAFPQTDGSAADTEAVLALERQWETAIKNKDQAAINRIVAEDCVLVSSTGELMTTAQANVETQLTTVGNSTIMDMKVRIFGNVAVVVGSNQEISKNRTLDTSGMYRWTDVFVKRDGRWQVVSAQSTRIE